VQPQGPERSGRVAAAREPARRPTVREHPVLRLQRAIGNRATSHLLQRVNGDDDGGEWQTVPKRGGKKAAAPPAPAAAPRAAPPPAAAPAAAAGATLVGSELRLDGAKVATVSAEQLANSRGERGAGHQVPLDVLADAARRAKRRWQNSKADEVAGGNYAYFFPVGDSTAANTWLCIVFNTGGVLLTSYTTTRKEVTRKVGSGSTVQFDNWAKDKHVYPSWR
jgi:hypothetical protein